MVNKLTRRNFLKLAGIGAGALTIPYIMKRKKKEENNMTIQIDSFTDSGYQASSPGFTWLHTMNGISLPYPGLVVGVSLFGSATVTSIMTIDVDVPQSLTFLRADTNGNYRSELWYLPNAVFNFFEAPTNEFSVDVILSASAPAVAGACVYSFFGGVGAHVGATGTTNNAEISITPTQLNSITFANFCISALGGAQSGGTHYDRWNMNSAENYGIGVDEGPWFLLDPVVLEFLNVGAEDVWALSAVELLDYQDNPPAIMGL